MSHSRAAYLGEVLMCSLNCVCPTAGKAAGCILPGWLNSITGNLGDLSSSLVAKYSGTIPVVAKTS